MNRLYERYSDRAAFYIVYIEEAHPTDAWQMAINVKQKVLFRNPVTETERSQVATSCVKNLGIRIPALVDDLNNSTERAYTAWPDRLYLIDAKGQVVYKSDPGPFGFDAKRLETELARLLPQTATMQSGQPEGQ